MITFFTILLVSVYIFTFIICKTDEDDINGVTFSLGLVLSTLGCLVLSTLIPTNDFKLVTHDYAAVNTEIIYNTSYGKVDSVYYLVNDTLVNHSVIQLR